MLRKIEVLCEQCMACAIGYMHGRDIMCNEVMAASSSQRSPGTLLILCRERSWVHDALSSPGDSRLLSPRELSSEHVSDYKSSKAEMYRTTFSQSPRPTDQRRLTVVSSQEAITVLGCHPPANVFLGVFQSDVHVTVETCEQSW